MGLGQDLVRQIRDATPIRRRKQLARRRVQVRVLTQAARVLPDLLIIGAQRSGTSSLYKHLGRHPEVVPALRKEVEYFSTSYTQGLGWYRAHFPLSARLALAQRGGRTRPVTFEATPDYMLDPRSPERAAALIPAARLIAVLRNPIDRAFSQYLHNRRLGHEDLSFEDALDAEPDRLSGEIERLLNDPDYQALPLRRHSYVTRGLYGEQLENWRKWFPPEATLVLTTDALFAEPGAAFGQISGFLGLRPWAPERFSNYSYSTPSAAPTEQMSPEVRQRLAATFVHHNRHLAEVIGVDPGWDTPTR